MKAGSETEVKRMLEFEVRDEVSEELARGKRIWNNTWLDPHKKMRLVSSRLVVNQGGSACKRDDEFAARGHGRYHGLWDVLVRPPKNMRKDKTIWKLLKPMYGTQVASSDWQRLASVPCVTYNENEDLLVSSHGDDFFAQGHDSSMDKLDEASGAFEIKRLPRVGPTAGREGVFLHSRIRRNESGFSYPPDPKHVDALSSLLVWLWSMAIHCTGQNGRGAFHETRELANREIRCAGTCCC